MHSFWTTGFDLALAQVLRALPPHHRRITLHPKPLLHQLSSFWRAASSKPDWTSSPLYSFRPANSHFSLPPDWPEFTSLLTSRPSFLHDRFTPKPLIPDRSDSEMTALVVHFTSNAVIPDLKPIMWQMQTRANLTHQRHIIYSPLRSGGEGHCPSSVLTPVHLSFAQGNLQAQSDSVMWSPQIKTTSCLVGKVLTDD